MIYLVKKICPKCNMKIELLDGHFGEKLECPNCNADISVPDLNKLTEEKERLEKQLEELKKNSNFTQTNTTSMGRPTETIKVSAATPVEDSDSSEELKKEKELTAKLKKEEEVLTGKLKGLQAANMSMNEQLSMLKAQKEEFSKSLDTIKDLQRQLDEKTCEVSKLNTKLEKYSAITQNLKEISTVGNLDVIHEDKATETLAAPGLSMDETLEVPKENTESVTKIKLDETLEVPKEDTVEISKEKFDETLQISMEAVQVTERVCSECGADYVITAKFCPKCGTRNDRYRD